MCTNKILQILATTQRLVLLLSHLLLLDDAELHAVALRQRHHGVVALADDEHVAQTSSEFVASGIAHVHDIEGSEVSVTVDDHSHTTDVVSLRDEAEVAHLELHVADHLVGLQVHLHGVVHLHGGVREADRASIVSHDERDLLGRQLALHHLAQLVLSLLLADAVKDEAALHVVQQTEAVGRTLQSHHIYHSALSNAMYP